MLYVISVFITRFFPKYDFRTFVQTKLHPYVAT